MAAGPGVGSGDVGAVDRDHDVRSGSGSELLAPLKQPIALFSDRQMAEKSDRDVVGIDDHGAAHPEEELGGPVWETGARAGDRHRAPSIIGSPLGHE